MKETAQKQLQLLSSRYGWVPQFVLKNMRLILLLLFAGLAGYLVYQINILVNNESSPVAAEQTEGTATPTITTNTSISKAPNQSVLSTFNELTVQNVQLDSDFDTSRDNPF